VLDGYDYSVVGLVGRAVLELVILFVFGERKLAWFLVRDICKFGRVGQCKRSVMEVSAKPQTLMLATTRIVLNCIVRVVL